MFLAKNNVQAEKGLSRMQSWSKASETIVYQSCSQYAGYPNITSQYTPDIWMPGYPKSKPEQLSGFQIPCSIAILHTPLTTSENGTRCPFFVPVEEIYNAMCFVAMKLFRDTSSLHRVRRVESLLLNMNVFQKGKYALVNQQS